MYQKIEFYVLVVRKSGCTLLLSLILSSCAILHPKYEEPTAGPIAEIKFMNHGTGVSTVEFFKEQESCSGREMSETIDRDNSKILKIKADSPISFSFGYNVTGGYPRFMYCRVYVTFNPESDKVYYAEIHPVARGCVLGVYETQTDGSLKNIPNIKKRTANTNVWTEYSSFCK